MCVCSLHLTVAITRLFCGDYFSIICAMNTACMCSRVHLVGKQNKRRAGVLVGRGVGG